LSPFRKVIAFCYASVYLGTRIIVALISQTWRIDECTIFVLAQKPSGSIAKRNTVSPALRIKHYSYSIEKTYIHWAKRYIPFHNKHHPEAVFFTAEMGAPEIEAFLTHLVQAENVAASTQNQAFNALLFLYRNALHVELNVPIHALCVKRAEHLPTVLLKA